MRLSATVLLCLLGPVFGTTLADIGLQRPAWVLKPSVQGQPAVGNDDVPDIRLESTSKRSKTQLPPTLAPPSLDFAAQPLCRPAEAQVTIMNTNARSDLKIFSLSSDTKDFQSTWVDREVVPPKQNSTFRVVFLGRKLGHVSGTLLLSTSQGETTYQVTAESVSSPNQLRPFTLARAPVGAAMVQQITMYNPTPRPIQVKEIYTSSPDIAIDVESAAKPSRPPTLLSDDLVSKEQHVTEPSASQWLLPPFKRTMIGSVVVDSVKPTTVSGFVNIKTNDTESDAVIPVEVMVQMDAGLFHGPGDAIDFGSMSPSDAQRHRPLNVFFRGSEHSVATVLDVRVDTCHHVNYPTRVCPGLRIHRRKDASEIHPFMWTRLATVSVSPVRHLDVTGYYTGQLVVEYQIAGQAHSKLLLVPMIVQYVHGHLELPGLDATFLIDRPPHKRQHKNITVRNRYNFPIKIRAVGVPDIISNLFEVHDFEPVVIAPDDNTSISLSFQANGTDAIVKSSLMLVTNHSDAAFRIPIYSYSGRLKYMVGEGQKGRDEIDFGDVPLDEDKTVLLHILNSNPVRIALDQYGVTLPEVSLTLKRTVAAGDMQDLVDYGQTFANSRQPQLPATTLKEQSPSEAVRALSVNLDPGHVASFEVTVNNNVKEGLHQGSIRLASTFGVMHIPMRYTGIKRLLNFKPPSITFPDLLPQQVVRGGGDELGLVMPRAFRRLTVPTPVPLHIRPDEETITIRKVFSTDERFSFERNPKVLKGLSAPMNSVVVLGHVSFSDTEAGNSTINYMPSIRESFLDAKELLPVLSLNDLEEVQRATRQWRKFKKATGGGNVTAELVIDVKGQQAHRIPLAASYSRPRLLQRIAAEFELTQVKTSQEQSLVFRNVANKPVLVNAVPLSEYMEDDLLTSLSSSLGFSAQDFADARSAGKSFFVPPFPASREQLQEAQGDDNLLDATKPSLVHFVVAPNSTLTVPIRFRPTRTGIIKSHMLFINNLTVVEVLRLAGSGGKGTFGFPKNQPNIVNGSLLLPVTAPQLSYCTASGVVMMTAEQANQSFRFSFNVVNRGSLPVEVESLSIGSQGCSAHGFTIEDCEPFTLAPKQNFMLHISFRPDFTVPIVRQRLSVMLSHHERPLLFSIIGSVPEDILPHCFNRLPPPTWASHLKTAVTALSAVIATAILIWQMSLESIKPSPEAADSAEHVFEDSNHVGTKDTETSDYDSHIDDMAGQEHGGDDDDGSKMMNETGPGVRRQPTKPQARKRRLQHSRLAREELLAMATKELEKEREEALRAAKEAAEQESDVEEPESRSASAGKRQGTSGSNGQQPRKTDHKAVTSPKNAASSPNGPNGPNSLAAAAGNGSVTEAIPGGKPLLRKKGVNGQNRGSLAALKQPGALPAVTDEDRLRKQALKLAEDLKKHAGEESIPSSRSLNSSPKSRPSPARNRPERNASASASSSPAVSAEASPQVVPVAPLNLAPSPKTGRSRGQGSWNHQHPQHQQLTYHQAHRAQQHRQHQHHQQQQLLHRHNVSQLRQDHARGFDAMNAEMYGHPQGAFEAPMSVSGAAHRHLDRSQMHGVPTSHMQQAPVFPPDAAFYSTSSDVASSGVPTSWAPDFDARPLPPLPMLNGDAGTGTGTGPWSMATSASEVNYSAASLWQDQASWSIASPDMGAEPSFAPPSSAGMSQADFTGQASWNNFYSSIPASSTAPSTLNVADSATVPAPTSSSSAPAVPAIAPIFASSEDEQIWGFSAEHDLAWVRQEDESVSDAAEDTQPNSWTPW